MFNFVGRRYLYFTISTIIIVLGLAAMVVSTVQFGTPLRLSVDFTGGTLWELQFQQPMLPGDVRQVFADRGYLDTI